MTHGSREVPSYRSVPCRACSQPVGIGVPRNLRVIKADPSGRQITQLNPLPDKYGVWQIIPGRTALQHSANHLNFWGPRLPDFVDVTLSML